MRKRKMYVQFEWPKQSERDHVGTLLEQLRYATGLVYHFEQGNGQHGAYLVALPAPKGTEEVQWAEMNAQRMRSFGIKADPVEDSQVKRHYS